MALPRYRPILRHLGDDKLSVDPGIGDRELELQLHRHLADIEADLLEEGQEVLSGQYLQPEEYEDKLRRYLEKVDDVKKSDLAAYVSRRRVILDLLAKAIQADRNGRYAREDVVHSLIMPMRATSDDAPESVSNLWVIDEGLAFHDYLASDKPIRSMPVTGSDSPLEPDLLAFRFTTSQSSWPRETAPSSPRSSSLRSSGRCGTTPPRDRRRTRSRRHSGISSRCATARS